MKYLFSLAFLLIFSLSFSQSDKKVDQAISRFKNGEYEKAISTMEKLVGKSPEVEDYWSLLIEMKLKYYYALRKKYQDELTEQLMKMLLSKENSHELELSDATPQLIDALKSCKEATLVTQSPIASQYLRNFLVDYSPDTSVTDEAKKAFSEGEEAFRAGEYMQAVGGYQKARRLQPDYYSATIYTGDAWWLLENMDSALYYFDLGIAIAPDLLEPRKYKVDALTYSQRNKEAKEEALKAILIYPDVSMFVKLDELYRREGKYLDLHWLARGCSVNRPGMASDKVKSSPWSTYRTANEMAAPLSDGDGLLSQPNELTGYQYLEVFSWEYMLENSSKLPEEMQFAREMMESEYLDCYVFICMFHHEMYPQYRHFADHNAERIERFINEFLVKD